MKTLGNVLTQRRHRRNLAIDQRVPKLPLARKLIFVRYVAVSDLLLLHPMNSPTVLGMLPIGVVTPPKFRTDPTGSPELYETKL